MTLSGCLGADDAPAATDATDDVQGDGMDLSKAVMFDDAAGDAYDTIGGAPNAGDPGSEYVDITAFGFAGENATHVAFELEIASLPSFEVLAAPTGLHRMTTYNLCWSGTPDGPCDRDLTLEVMPHAGGAHTQTNLMMWTGDCTEWGWCAWGAESTVAFGTPATISFTVPKAYLDWDGGGRGIFDLAARTTSFVQADVFPSWHPGVTAHTPVWSYHTHGGAIGLPEGHDGTGAADLAVHLDAVPDVADPPAALPLVIGTKGLNHGPNSPYSHAEMDIHWFDLFEEGDDLVARFVVDQYHELPEYDFDYSAAVGYDGLVYEIGYRHEGGKAYGYAGRCIMEFCEDAYVFEPLVEIQTGSPAIIDVRTPKAEIGSPAAGVATDLFWVMTMVSDVNYYFGDPTSDDIFGDYHSVFMVDSYIGGTPFVFGSEHQAPPDWALPGMGHEHA